MQVQLRWALGRVLPIVLLALLFASAARHAYASSGATSQASVSTNGASGSYWSWDPVLSTDGRFVAFQSYSDTLVAGDTNQTDDIFVRDRRTWITTRVNVTTSGAQLHTARNPSISGDGRFVAFVMSTVRVIDGRTQGVDDIFLRDRDTDNDGVFDEPGAVATTIESVPEGGGQTDFYSAHPVLSADGRYLAYYSFATNLVAGDANGIADVFVRDLQTKITVRVSLSSEGAEGHHPIWASDASSGSFTGSISGDGRYVAFSSNATDLVPGDTNDSFDVFVRDRDADSVGVYDEAGSITTTRQSLSSGDYQGNADSTGPAITADGRHLAWSSLATNLVEGDTNNRSDVFVRDLVSGQTAIASVSTGGASANNRSEDASISADGRYVIFTSFAYNLVSDGPSSFYSQTYMRDRDSDNDGIYDEPGAVATSRESVSSSGETAGGHVYDSVISSDGKVVAFISSDDALSATGRIDYQQVFVHDMNPRDTSPPGVSVTSPIPGTSVRGTTTLSASAVDNHYVVKVDFVPLNRVVGTDRTPDSSGSYSVSWDTTSMPDGPRNMIVRAYDSSANTGYAPRYLVVDNALPTATAPAHTLVLGSTLGASAIPVKLSWSGSDGPGGPVRFRLEQRTYTNGAWGAWSVLDSTTAARTRTVALRPGMYQFRTKALDYSGNESSWMTGQNLRLAAYQEASTAPAGKVGYTGTWTRHLATAYYGGSARHTSKAGHTATLTFTGGRQVAWIAPKGPSRGYAYVYLDGAKVAAVNLYSSSAQYRKVVFAKTNLTPSVTHTLKVYVTGTKPTASTGTRVDIDGFVLLR